MADEELRTWIATWLRSRSEEPLDERAVDALSNSNFGQAVQRYRDEHGGRYPDPNEYQPFPHDEEGFETALRAFARKNKFGPPEVLAEIENNAAAFEKWVEFHRNTGTGKMLRAFHALRGRYPEYEEVFPPDGPSLSAKL
jgi:hypothetical protein